MVRSASAVDSVRAGPAAQRLRVSGGQRGGGGRPPAPAAPAAPQERLGRARAPEQGGRHDCAQKVPPFFSTSDPYLLYYITKSI